jgi:gliding motility-associated-like protein
MLLFLLLEASGYRAQLVAGGAPCLGETTYTDGQPNDVVYYYPAGQLGELTITPQVAGSSFNFVWSRFIPGNNNWSPYTTQNNQATSAISGLQPGAYFVSVRNSSNVILECYRAWIAQVIQEPQVDVQPIPSNCVGPVNLVANFTPGQVSPLSNLPESQLLIDANTEITVCFSGNHTYVSDLAFYLRGPASCGTPNLLLSQYPGLLGLGSCNGGNNFNNLCFTTESTNNLNVCGAPTPLTGTFGRYGPGATQINWPAIYGCDAMNGGWAVQVYDCVGIDVGALTDATITFTGFDMCGTMQTVTYSTPNPYSSPINDGTCNSASASIFTVTPASIPALLDCTFGYEWTSNPPVNISNATSSLNITLNSLTDAAGNAIPWQDVDFTLTATINCDALAEGNNCFGSNMSDTETYNNNAPTIVTIDDPDPICIDSAPIQLTADVPGGTWSGTGITEAALGTFDPAIAGQGMTAVSYTFTDPCFLPDDALVSVEIAPNLSFNVADDVCENDTPFPVSPSIVGAYSGTGITDAALGVFDPAIAGQGTHTLTVVTSTVCPVTLTDDIIVNPLPVLVVSPNTDVCPGDVEQIDATGADTYVWSPATYLDADNIASPTASLGATTTYTVTGTSSFGCEASGSVTLTLLAAPTITVVPPVLTCPGTVVTLDAQGSTGTWEWTLADGSSLGTGSPIDLTFDETTIVTAEVTDACLNTATIQVTVPIEAIPEVDAGSDVILCTGSTVTIQADVVGNYANLQWSTLDGAIGGAANLPAMQTSTEGTYMATIITPLGCTYADDVFVDVVPLPIVDAGSNTDVCSGQPFSLGATGAATYSWQPANWLNNATIPNPSATIITPVTFTVTGTDLNGCVNTDLLTLSIIPQPLITGTSVSMICPGAEVTLTVNATAGNVVWQPAASLNTAFGTSVNASPSTTTQYTATLTDVCGAQDQVQINVPVEQLYTVNAGADENFCEGESVWIQATVTGTYPSISWSNNIGLIVGETTESIAVSSQGTYIIEVETPLGCVYEDVVFVDEIAYPSFILADTLSYCPGASATLTVPGTWQQVVWSNGTSASTINVSQEGTYGVVVNDQGCITEDEIVVYQVDLPALNLGPNREICQGETTVFTSAVIGEWSTGANGDSIVVATAGTYTFTYTEEGCSVSDEVDLVVNPLPYIDVINTQYGCMEQSYTIVINDFAAGNYEWIDGSEEPYLIVDQPGDYWFMVTNECGSRAETITVVFEDCDEAVYIPSSFTPDNDGVNDAWKIVTRNINSMQTRVMNRWGQVVFESEDISPVWVGGFDTGDSYVSDGLYFFRVEFERRNGQREVREGSMFMLR